MYEWTAQFTQSVTLKTFMENISNVVTEGYFRMVCTDDFQGLETDTLDGTQIALVKGRMSARVTGKVTVENSKFCIKISTVLSCLRNAHAQHFVDISCPRDSSDVIISVYEPAVSTFTPTFRLRTLAKEFDVLPIRTEQYKFMVEIDLHTFRSAVKTAKEHRADIMTLKVLQPVQKSDTRRTTFFVVEYAAEEVKSVFPYRSVTDEEIVGENGDMHLVIKATESTSEETEQVFSEDDTVILFSGRFATDYLCNFTKSMDRSTMILRLNPPDAPLVIDFTLGCSTRDFIRYILAPREPV